MGKSYTQIHIHLIFAIKNPSALIEPEWRDRLQKYITGIVQNQGSKLLAINAQEDHIHIFIGLNPETPLSDLVRDVKTHSTAFINNEKFVKSKFFWQEGYGAFSYNHSQIDAVVKYINQQDAYHQTKSFRKEYLNFLKVFEVPYEEKYLFDFFGKE